MDCLDENKKIISIVPSADLHCHFGHFFALSSNFALEIALSPVALLAFIAFIF